MTLYEIGQDSMALYEMLQNDEIDEQTVQDTIESFGVEGKLEDYAKIIRQLNADAAALEMEEARMEKRRKTVQNSIKRLQNNLVLYFSMIGKDKADAGIFKMAVRKSKAVNILDLNIIPDEFKRQKVTVEADKKAIKEALEAGETVAGAEIQINKSINIR